MKLTLEKGDVISSNLKVKKDIKLELYQHKERDIKDWQAYYDVENIKLGIGCSSASIYVLVNIVKDWLRVSWLESRDLSNAAPSLIKQKVLLDEYLEEF